MFRPGEVIIRLALEYSKKKYTNCTAGDESSFPTQYVHSFCVSFSYIFKRLIYRVSIKSFPNYKHLLHENYVEYKHIFFTIT